MEKKYNSSVLYNATSLCCNQWRRVKYHSVEENIWDTNNWKRKTYNRK